MVPFIKIPIAGGWLASHASRRYPALFVAGRSAAICERWPGISGGGPSPGVSLGDSDIRGDGGLATRAFDEEIDPQHAQHENERAHGRYRIGA